MHRLPSDFTPFEMDIVRVITSIREVQNVMQDRVPYKITSKLSQETLQTQNPGTPYPWV
jgi:hypothetical protein